MVIWVVFQFFDRAQGDLRRFYLRRVPVRLAGHTPQVGQHGLPFFLIQVQVAGADVLGLAREDPFPEVGAIYP